MKLLVKSSILVTLLCMSLITIAAPTGYLQHKHSRQSEPSINLQSQRPERITTGGTSLYGWLTYASHSFTRGLYSFEGTAGYNYVWGVAEGNCVTTAWLNQGRVCGYLPIADYQGSYGMRYLEYDFETGEELVMENLDYTNENRMLIATYNSNDGKIYGYGMYNNQYCFMTATPRDPDNYQVIKNYGVNGTNELCHSLCFNPTDGYIYGVNYRDEFVQISLDGTQNAIMKHSFSDIYRYITGLVYSPVEKVYYWNVNFSNQTSAIYTIDVANQEISLYCNLPDYEDFVALFTTDLAYDELQPKSPEILEINFPEGALSGTVKLKMPSELENGSVINDDLLWCLSIDNMPINDGSAQPGTEVEVKVAKVSQGNHSVDAFVYYDSKRSALVSNEVYFGVDTPKAPSNVVLNRTGIYWDAVTEGVNGGYINLTDLKYNVTLNDSELGILTDTYIEGEIPETPSLQAWVATVTAMSCEKKSETVKSNKLITGPAYTLPVEFTPTPEEFDLCITYDLNNDGKNWGYNTRKSYLYTDHTSNVAVPMDDWLMLPPINVEDASKYYSVSFESCLLYASYPYDYLEVWICSDESPDSEKELVIEKFQPGVDYTEYSGIFHVKSPGRYFIGLHCVSDGDQGGLAAKNFKISSEGVTENSPGKVENLIVKAAPKGELKATVSFDFPSTNMVGGNLNPDIDLDANVTLAETVKVSGKPGAHAEVEIEAAQGMNAISVVVTDGVLNGLESVANVFVGIDIPTEFKLESDNVADDMLSMELRWTAPAVGVNGGYVDPEKVVYDVYYQMYDAAVAEDEWIRIADGMSGLSYTFKAKSKEQTRYKVGVIARNEMGSDENMAIAERVLGVPYALPFEEDFENMQTGTDSKLWNVMQPDPDYMNAQWRYSPMKRVDSKYENVQERGLYCEAYTAEAKAMMTIPYFTVGNNDNVTLKLNIYRGPLSADVKIFGIGGNNLEPVEIASIEGGDEGLEEMNFELPESLTESSFATLRLELYFPNITHKFFLASMSITDDVTEVVSIEDSTATFKIDGRHVLICGNEGSDYEIATLQGCIVKSGKCQSQSIQLDLNPGVYVLKVGKSMHKVIVK